MSWGVCPAWPAEGLWGWAGAAPRAALGCQGPACPPRPHVIAVLPTQETGLYPVTLSSLAFTKKFSCVLKSVKLLLFMVCNLW